MRFTLSLTLLVLLVLPFAAHADAPELGRPLPALAEVEWLTDPPPPCDEPGGTTVLEFWATWSPVSRLLLHAQDAAPREGVRYVAVSQEEPTTLRQFAQRAGWSRLALASDQERRLFDTVFTPLTDGTSGAFPRQFPFALIIGDDSGRGPGTLLWAGPMNDWSADDPTGAFDAALDAIVAGRYDVDATIAREETATRNRMRFQELDDAVFGGDPATIDRILGEFEADPAIRGDRAAFGQTMNSVAWITATQESATAEMLALAERAIELSLASGGDTSPNIIDTQARVYWVQGRHDEAVATQTRAVEMAAGTPNRDHLLATLNQYLTELGRPAYVSEADGAESAASESAVWSGDLNAAGEAYGGEQVVAVRPDIAEPEIAAAWNSYAGFLEKHIFTAAPMVAASAVTADDFAGRAVALYGTAASNPWIAEVCARYNIRLTADGIRAGDTFLAAENPVLITCLPNPWSPELPVALYTAYREQDAVELNSFFHGPTSLMLGRWIEGGPNTLAQLDWTLGDDGAPVLVLPPRRLTHAQAREDLLALHDQLHVGYAAYEDIQWDLLMEGSSWADRTTRFLDRFKGPGAISWEGFYKLALDYLDPVSDTHFTVQGFNPATSRRVGARLIRSQSAYFTGLVVERRDGRDMIIATPPGLERHVGDRVVGVPVIDSPHTLRPGEPYLFPTLSAEGEPTEGRFLVGTLAWNRKAPSSLPLTVRSGDPRRGGAAVRLDLPLHRGRTRLQNIDRAQGHWTRDTAPDGETTVLGVRSMEVPRLAGLVETADELRNAPRLILDLRGNYGGSDRPAMDWCPRFSRQMFRRSGWVGTDTGETDPLRRYQSAPGEFLSGSPDTMAPGPYGGRLWILVDGGVASSGETFTQLSSQIEGAILLGENTFGCVNYGNVAPHDPLPNSGLKLHFGRSRFVVDWVRPIREGIGFFPDYWLDCDDPVGLLCPGNE